MPTIATELCNKSVADTYIGVMANRRATVVHDLLNENDQKLWRIIVKNTEKERETSNEHTKMSKEEMNDACALDLCLNPKVAIIHCDENRTKTLQELSEMSGEKIGGCIAAVLLFSCIHVKGVTLVIPKRLLRMPEGMQVANSRLHKEIIGAIAAQFKRMVLFTRVAGKNNGWKMENGMLAVMMWSNMFPGRLVWGWNVYTSKQQRGSGDETQVKHKPLNLLHKEREAVSYHPPENSGARYSEATDELGIFCRGQAILRVQNASTKPPLQKLLDPRHFDGVGTVVAGWTEKAEDVALTGGAEEQRVAIGDFPPEIEQLIIGKMGSQDIQNMAVVSKRHRDLVRAALTSEAMSNEVAGLNNMRAIKTFDQLVDSLRKKKHETQQRMAWLSSNPYYKRRSMLAAEAKAAFSAVLDDRYQDCSLLMQHPRPGLTLYHVAILTAQRLRHAYDEGLKGTPAPRGTILSCDTEHFYAHLGVKVFDEAWLTGLLITEPLIANKLVITYDFTLLTDHDLQLSMYISTTGLKKDGSVPSFIHFKAVTLQWTFDEPDTCAVTLGKNVGITSTKVYQLRYKDAHEIQGVDVLDVLTYEKAQDDTINESNTEITMRGKSEALRKFSIGMIILAYCGTAQYTNEDTQMLQAKLVSVGAAFADA